MSVVDSVLEAFTGDCARCHRPLPVEPKPPKRSVGQWLNGFAVSLALVVFLLALSFVAVISCLEADRTVQFVVSFVVGTVATTMVIWNNVNHGAD
jgi:hypothetical protein